MKYYAEPYDDNGVTRLITGVKIVIRKMALVFGLPF